MVEASNPAPGAAAPAAAAEPQSMQPTPSNAGLSRMNLGGSALGAAGGGGSAWAVSYFWNWIAVRDWGAPPMDISDATALATMLAPVVTWAIGWLPQPRVKNRRS